MSVGPPCYKQAGDDRGQRQQEKCQDTGKGRWTRAQFWTARRPGAAMRGRRGRQKGFGRRRSRVFFKRGRQGLRDYGLGILRLPNRRWCRRRRCYVREGRGGGSRKKIRGRFQHGCGCRRGYGLRRFFNWAGQYFDGLARWDDGDTILRRWSFSTLSTSSSSISVTIPFRISVYVPCVSLPAHGPSAGTGRRPPPGWPCRRGQSARRPFPGKRPWSAWPPPRPRPSPRRRLGQ